MAVAAGLATLRARERRGVRGAEPQLRARSASWPAQALTAAGVAHQVQYAGNLVSVFFSRRARCTTSPSAQAAETFRYRPFFHAMLDAGVYLPPSAFEAWFVNAAMDDVAIGRVADALPAAARAAAGATPPTSG